jgi:hypothetical protein
MYNRPFSYNNINAFMSSQNYFENILLPILYAPEKNRRLGRDWARKSRNRRREKVTSSTRGDKVDEEFEIFIGIEWIHSRQKTRVTIVLSKDCVISRGRINLASWESKM